MLKPPDSSPSLDGSVRLDGAGFGQLSGIPPLGPVPLQR